MYIKKTREINYDNYDYIKNWKPKDEPIGGKNSGLIAVPKSSRFKCKS